MSVDRLHINASIKTSAAIASTTGTARMAIQGSCRAAVPY